MVLIKKKYIFLFTNIFCFSLLTKTYIFFMKRIFFKQTLIVMWKLASIKKLKKIWIDGLPKLYVKINERNKLYIIIIIIIIIILQRRPH
jgi:hypothetical protein